jgi:hypothetical protein
VDIDLDVRQRQLLERMGDSSSAKPLAILLESLKPVRAANRAKPNDIRPATSFNRLVDAADPDSMASPLMGLSISDLRGRSQDIRGQLTRWHDNSIAVKPILERYPNLREVIPLAEHVRDLSAAALEALDYLDQGRKPSRTWATRQRQSLERAGVPQADLTITLVDTLRTLIVVVTANR